MESSQFHSNNNIYTSSLSRSSYSSLISIENIFQAWEEFKKGKCKKLDVQVFERNLEDNLFLLHARLINKTYKHGKYMEFYVSDPKRRHTHKAEVADRIVHHLLYKYLYGVFDKTFIYDSYSCRLDKGTHRAVRRLERFTRGVSKNYTQDCWVLKLDIKKFFASVDHEILKELIKTKVKDRDIFWIIGEIIDSFYTGHSRLDREADPRVCEDDKEENTNKGIPLGNLTSQIFANIYLNELDQFIKHRLTIKYYLRYADDFLLLNQSKTALLHCFKTVKQYLGNNLDLEIHPNKTCFCKLSWGIDFCGYIVLPHYILPRTKTKRRIIKKVIKGNISNHSLQSYLGYFSHADSCRLQKDLISIYFFTSLL